jgi:hypothetical protein
MPVQIDTMELQLDSTPAGSASTLARPAPPLPTPQQALREAWLAERRAELQARWSAFDRDDER